MKISIRFKFFIVLLAFSLGPLLLARAFTGRTADSMVRKLSAHTRSELLDIVTAELQHNAITLMKIMESGGQSMVLGSDSIAHLALTALEEAPPHSSKPTCYSIDFYDPEEMPFDAVESPEYVKLTRSGKAKPMMVSFGQPAIHMAEGVDDKKMAGQIRQLEGLTPYLRNIHDQLESYGYTIQVSLESGVMLTYPGRGGFPRAYDPRQKEWYKRSRKSHGHVWTSPVVEPTTKLAVSTISTPIRDKEGRFLGVVSMDIPLTNILHATSLKSKWSEDLETYMVVRHPREDGKEGLLIVAQESYDDRATRRWRTGIKAEWLAENEPDTLDKLVFAMNESENGFLELPFNKKPSVCAFASNDHMTILLIAPVQVVQHLPDQVVGGIDSLMDQMRNISFFISGVMLIVVGVIAWFGSQAITRPIIGIAAAAKRIASGDFTVHIPWRNNDERDILIDAFNDMVPKLEEHMLISKDLELAKEVQRLLLPSNEPEFGGYDLSGGISYCDQTGGDYYDFIDMNSRQGKALGVVLGDVSGHGVPAALVMAATRGQLHSLSQVPLEPHARIRTINDLLSEDLDGTGRFITMFYLRLHENSDKVTWVRAGHDPAVWYSPDSDSFDELNGDGIALGVLPEFQYDSYTAKLAVGDVLVLATDGVWEARNAEGEMFGKQRMLAIIRENAHNDAVTIRRAIMGAVRAFHPDGQEDDIAVVVIRKL